MIRQFWVKGILKQKKCKNLVIGHDRGLMSHLASLYSSWYLSQSKQLIQMLNECVIICVILWIGLTCEEFLSACMWLQNKNVMVYFGSLFQILSLFSSRCWEKNRFINNFGAIIVIFKIITWLLLSLKICCQ